VSKKRTSAEVIQAAMQTWIERAMALDGTCCRCEAPVPMALAVPNGGCNWTEGFAPVRPGCQGFMAEIVARAKAEFDLIT